MGYQIVATSLGMVDMRTRMPFRFGIVQVAAMPHIMLDLSLVVDGKQVLGQAAESLVPKWFQKDPESTHGQDVNAMLAVIEQACKLALETPEATTPFAFWQSLYARQAEWGTAQGYPSLLWGLGLSLVERAIIDGACRAAGIPFGWALRSGHLGFQPGELHSELAGRVWQTLLPEAPRREVFLRHTIGMSDPLHVRDISHDQRVEDGLPQALDECIDSYGLKYFKMKLCGQDEQDRERLVRVLALLEERSRGFKLTLDGNEQYPDLDAFAASWERLVADPDLASLKDHLLFVEQPLPRAVSLLDSTFQDLKAWRAGPPIIIDESDGDVDTARRAMDGGYAGTSHKNCKGVFKSIANACLSESRRQANPAAVCIMSSEDLTNIGPLALLQDLSVLASLGMTHTERNGHHYLRGLSMFPGMIQDRTVEEHGKLFHRHADGFATLTVNDGSLQLGSVVDSGLGWHQPVDTSFTTPLSEWDYSALAAVQASAIPCKPS